MKKALAILFSAVLALSLSVSAYADENIALTASGATIEASSTNSAQPLSNINDGDSSSYWEAADPNSTNEWISLSWEDVYSISDIKMLWGGGKPSAGNGAWAGYGSVEYSVDGETFKPLTFSVERASNPNDQHGLPYTDDINWNGDLYAKAIRINFAAFANSGAYQCYEVEVYGEKFEGEIPEELPSETPSEAPSETPSETISTPAPTPSTTPSTPSASTSEAVSSDAPAGGEDNGNVLPLILIIGGALLVVVAVVVVIIVKKKKA